MSDRRTVPLFVVAWGLVAAGTLVVGGVAPIVAVGVAQLGAASAMALSARGHAPWERFWGWLALASGLKHLLASVGWRTPEGSGLDPWLSAATVLVVGAFVALVMWWWRQGALRRPPAVTSGPLVGVSAALFVWALATVAAR